jgi:hypothetical protein
MVSVKNLSASVVGEILNTVDPKHQFSETQLSEVTRKLNDILSDYALSEEERDVEPTAKELNKQIDALQSALKRLRLALPKPTQRSLFNYVVHVGEAYAEANGPHPNVERQTVHLWDWSIGEDGDEVSFELNHFHSNKRLQEMIDSVTQVSAWLDYAASRMKADETNWIDNTPYWLDAKNMFERLGHPEEFLRPVDAHRLRQTERLIGLSLPRVYETTFGKKFTVSRSESGALQGPGIRFVMEVLRCAGVTKKGAKQLSKETIARYWSKGKKKERLRHRRPPPPPLYKRG